MIDAPGVRGSLDMPPAAANPQANGTNANGNKQPVVCVFCGSSDGTSPTHLAAARELATALAAHNAKLVYGGGTTGLMGEIARTLVAQAGPESVHGVIPRALLQFEAPEAADGASDAAAATAASVDSSKYGRTTVVADMHTRKALMTAEVRAGGPGSGFVALSGGFGTMEELMEVTTWNQLGIHALPVVTYNVDGYWDGLLKWIGDAVAAGFIRKANGDIVQSGNTADEVMHKLLNYQNSEGRFQLQWSQS